MSEKQEHRSRFEAGSPPMDEYIPREAAYPLARKICDAIDKVPCCILGNDILDFIDDIPAADVRLVPEGGIGEMSDGYHTFNGLYYQRMVLFAALVKAHKDKAWKSWKHEDGEPCFGGGWFIVGVDTQQGSYTYHYEAKDFDLFDCKELPVAKHWDGHTEEDVTRLLSLDVRPVTQGEWIDHQEGRWIYAKCSECGTVHDVKSNFCPNCGARMAEEGET